MHWTIELAAVGFNMLVMLSGVMQELVSGQEIFEHTAKRLGL